jgi:hypothetical protein
LEEFRLETLLNGKYDHNSAVLSLHAGAGGVEAMDWAEMLLRMYTRWAEQRGYKVNVVDLQDDTEAGIKSATIFIEGEIDERYYVKPEDRAQGKTSPYGFKVKKIMLLGNVTDTYLKGFAVNISTTMLTPEFRDSLVGLIKKNKGNVPLSMFLYDPEKNWNIEFLSRKFRVGVTAGFIEELEKLNVRYTVLKK